MARTNLTINALAANGVATIVPTTIDEIDGAMFVNNGLVGLYVVNNGIDAADITLLTGLTVEGFTVSNQTTTIPNGEARWLSRHTMATFNQTGADAGSVYIDVTDAMEVIAFSLS